MPRLFFVLFLATACVSTEGIPKCVVITRADNGKSIAVSAWQTFQVRLKEPGGTGYMWHIVDLDKAHLKRVSSAYRPIGRGNTAGAPILRIWDIKALKKSKTYLSLLLFRPSGTGKPADSFRVAINIE